MARHVRIETTWGAMNTNYSRVRSCLGPGAPLVVIRILARQVRIETTWCARRGSNSPSILFRFCYSLAPGSGQNRRKAPPARLAYRSLGSSILPGSRGIPWSSSESWQSQVRIEATWCARRGSNSPYILFRFCYSLAPGSGQNRRKAPPARLAYRSLGSSFLPGSRGSPPGRHPNLGKAKFG